MKHGEVRNHREETVLGPTQKFVDARTREHIATTPAWSMTHTVEERWCEGCQRWFEVKGIIGALTFAFEHDKHVE